MIVNKTPHPIHIVGVSGEVIKTFPKCEPDQLIRLSMSTSLAGDVNGTPITKTVFGDPIGLPEFSEGTYYIVSQLVKNAFPNREDLLVPAEMVRDQEGNIVGCKSLGI